MTCTGLGVKGDSMREHVPHKQALGTTLAFSLTRLVMLAVYKQQQAHSMCTTSPRRLLAPFLLVRQ